MKSNIFLFVFLIFSAIFASAETKNKNEKFEKPIVRFLPAMKSCRSTDAVQDVTVAGKIVIDYEINDKGSLHRLKINDDKTTISDLNLQKCVIDVMKKIKFPKAPKGKTVSVSYPVIFK